MASPLPRLWNDKGFKPFRLEVLTPVFVGSGEQFSPLEYTIRKEKDGYVLYLVDGAAWLQAHAGDPAVNSALDSGDMARLRCLVHERLDVASYAYARLPVTLPETGKELQKRIEDRQSNSKAEVLPFMRTPMGGAFLPGSSLKGALSTPLIDALNKRRSAADRLSGWNYDSVLQRMFGDIPTHAMQALKVADIPLAPRATAIVTAREARRAPAPDKRATPKPPCEALLPSGETATPPPYGSLHLDCRNGQPAVTLPGGEQISWRELGELCRAFYTRRFQEEWERFYATAHLEEVGRELRAVRDRVERLDPECEWLVRVGRYAHIECVTVSHRAPNHAKGYGKTRTLADGKRPFGWVILRFCPPEDHAEGVRAVRLSLDEAQQELRRQRAAQEQRLQERAAQQRLRREAAAKVEAERQRREREAGEREARLAGLSPQERALRELLLPDADDDTALCLYRQLDSMDAPLQRQAAEALKTFWQERGKWQGKKISIKQKEKTAYVKRILGE